MHYCDFHSVSFSKRWRGYLYLGRLDGTVGVVYVVDVLETKGASAKGSAYINSYSLKELND